MGVISLLMLCFSCCSVVCEDEKQAVAVKSQLQQLARPMYSNPPLHGAQIVSTILGDADLKNLWLKEVKVIYHDLVSSLFIPFSSSSSSFLSLLGLGWKFSSICHRLEFFHLT